MFLLEKYMTSSNEFVKYTMEVSTCAKLGI